MLNSPLVGLPGVGTVRTATHRQVILDREHEIAGGITIDGTKARDVTNSRTTLLRGGLILGKITATSRYANFCLGLLASAYDGGASLTIPVASAVELARRVGSSGTLDLGGPATGGGTFRQKTATYSAVDQTTGVVTVTPLSVNEVQTVALGATMSAGTIAIGATSSAGVRKQVKVAYNTSWTQTVADIQTALNAALGASAVACAVTNTSDMTITFSGTNYAGLPQDLVTVDVSAATSTTKGDVTRTTAGVDGRFAAQTFILPVDGSGVPKLVLSNGFGVDVLDQSGTAVVLQLPDMQGQTVVMGGLVDVNQLLPYPTDSSCKAWLKNTLRAAGQDFVFSDDLA